MDSLLYFLGATGRGFFLKTNRIVQQVHFVGRLLVLSLYENSGRFPLLFRLTLAEVYKIVTQTFVLLTVISVLAGFLWSQIWFGSLSNIGGEAVLIRFLASIHTLVASPIIVALVVLMRYGVSMALEIATIKADYQFETLAGIGIAPEHLLAVPRLWACLLVFPALLAFSNLATITGAYMGGWSHTNTSVFVFFNNYNLALSLKGLISLAIKCEVTALTVPFFCLYSGWQIKIGQLKNQAGMVVRNALGEGIFYSILGVILVTISYG